MITNKIYYENQYKADFEAKIVDIRNIDSTMHIALDESCFYIGGGGQPADYGTLDDVGVIDVYVKDGLIYHVIKHNVNKFAVGDTTKGRIDMRRRLAFMQNHTGEHILSGIANSLFCATNVGFHMSEKGFTMDLDKHLNIEDLRRLEDIANDIVAQNKMVDISNISGKEVEMLKPRAKRDFADDDNVRIVKIDDCDICACAALHVKNTSEVGLIKIVSHEKYKGGIRLYVFCGADAFWDYSRKNEILRKISTMFSADIDNVVPTLEGKISTISSLKKHTANLQNELFVLKAQLVEKDTYIAHFFETDLDNKDMRRLAQLAANVAKIGIVFVEQDGVYRYVASSDDNCILSNFIAEMNIKFDGKGSCRDGLAQGVVNADNAEIIAFLEVAYEKGRI
ncbi:MAG: alanine--tRNA ligase-related protein [Defluviitaleaceae bacterium]|nr:alanine--tRNA ligase-related protein [Defluviitaleaceae bacterium]MCL2576140.1 alanine--tRNA ligase-related protein [Defluviitaleaceae bacterium]